MREFKSLMRLSPTRLLTIVMVVVAIGRVSSTAVGTDGETLVPWGPGCNDPLLAGPFSLQKAPEFRLSPEASQRINEVIEEVRGGYGGTLVTAPRDDTLDSAAFLAHYLRAFATVEDPKKYDYRFERILERLSRAEVVLQDPKLDWDIWRAYLLFENWVAAGNDGNNFRTTERGNTYSQGLDSAKELLWRYLFLNDMKIRDDKLRRDWWCNALTQGMKAPGGRPWRRWFVLQLVTSTDTKTSALITPEEGKQDARLSVRRPSPFEPFIQVEGAFAYDSVPTGKTFAEAIKEIAESQKLSYVLWDINPASMPPTKAVQTDLGRRLSQSAPAMVVSQESWSKTPQAFGPSTFRPIGRRSPHSNVGLPIENSTDGVYFFTYDARLYVWPKARMDDAAVQMLQVSRVVDDEQYARLLARGFKKLAAKEGSKK